MLGDFADLVGQRLREWRWPAFQSQSNCSPHMYFFQWCINYNDIARRSSAIKSTIRIQFSKMAGFNLF